jgi:hypothetical protein
MPSNKIQGVKGGYTFEKNSKPLPPVLWMDKGKTPMMAMVSLATLRTSTSTTTRPSSTRTMSRTRTTTSAPRRVSSRSLSSSKCKRHSFFECLLHYGLPWIQRSHPASEHSPNFVENFFKSSVLFIVYRFNFFHQP